MDESESDSGSDSDSESDSAGEVAAAAQPRSSSRRRRPSRKWNERDRGPCELSFGQDNDNRVQATIEALDKTSINQARISTCRVCL